jgi:hypothetical protein
MKTLVPLFIAVVCLIGVSNSQTINSPAAPMPMTISAVTADVPGGAPASPMVSPTTYEMKYWTNSTSYFNWTVPGNYGSFVNLYLMQRFTLPNNGGFLDSLSIWIEDVSGGNVLFRVWPCFATELGGQTYLLPQFGVQAIDSVLISKDNLKMKAFNSVKMRGALVPKEFYITIEFTFQGGSNNTIIVRGDNHTQSGRSPVNSRVVMFNQNGQDLSFALMDSMFVESGTQKPIYSYLLMSAFADTATFSPETKIVTTPKTSGYANVKYVYNCHAVGIPRPAYRLVNGPSTMAVDWYSGTVEWTPTNQDAGPHSVTIEAFNQNNTDQQTFTIDVSAASAPKITSYAIRSALVGEPYFYQVTATGGPAPTFSLTCASLPGLKIDAQTGLVSVTPTAANIGSHIVGITASNALGNDQQSYTLTVASTASGPRIVSSPVIIGSINQKYVYQVSSSGNPSPTYSLTKSPAGMIVNANTGLIEWTPTQSGSFPITVRAENRVSADSQSFSIAVSAASTAPLWASNPKALAIADQLYTDTLLAFGTPTPQYTLVSGPGGLIIDGLTGKVTWTPSRAQKGPNAVKVRATNSAGNTDKDYTITVRAVPRITSSEVFTGKVGQLYSYQVTADAEPAATFSLGSFPTGMTINSTTGLISWTPDATQAGQYNLKVIATNTVGSDQQAFTVDIGPATAVDPISDAAGYLLGQNYPNPVFRADNPVTYVSFTLPATAHVSIEVVNVYGEVVAKLFDGMETAGQHAIAFDTQATRHILPAGQYLVRMTSGTVTRSRMMTIVK